jgi:hypothetical protein
LYRQAARGQAVGARSGETDKEQGPAAVKEAPARAAGEAADAGEAAAKANRVVNAAQVEAVNVAQVNVAQVNVAQANGVVVNAAARVNAVRVDAVKAGAAAGAVATVDKVAVDSVDRAVADRAVADRAVPDKEAPDKVDRVDRLAEGGTSHELPSPWSRAASGPDLGHDAGLGQPGLCRVDAQRASRRESLQPPVTGQGLRGIGR